MTRVDHPKRNREERVHTHPATVRGPRPDPGSAYLLGHDDGVKAGRSEGYARGKQEGYAEGLEEGIGIGVRAGVSEGLEIAAAVIQAVGGAKEQLVEQVSRAVLHARLGGSPAPGE